MAPGGTLPVELARRRLGVLRPRDAADVYAHPRAEFARLAERGLLRRVATGYFVRVPPERVGDHGWRPDLHATALGVAAADYGRDAVALMHLSAARRHAALPRELALAVVAVPKQRPPLTMLGGTVTFARRDVTRLDVERLRTDLVESWVTTVEQTVLDLAARPDLGGVDAATIREAIQSLGRRADWGLVDELAAQQRRRTAAGQAREIAARA
jgi:predicted transcriptional regulator of viral defense system